MPIDPNDPAFIDPRVQVLTSAARRPVVGQEAAEKREILKRAGERPMDLIWRALRS